ncbi:uncharacterized protein [Drosophila suzukii]|uniref:Uncharacterized protein n=1 Tax=Drosophila suzukii TaxID=28584 RepID=A0AB39Z4V8_DROSZ
MQVHSIGCLLRLINNTLGLWRGKLRSEVFIRGQRGWTPKMWRLLLLWITVVLVAALDEREFDPQVAPPQSSVSKPFQLWRNFANQVRLVFSRFQSTTPTPPTVKTRMRIITTTPEPELQLYGALNPIYQTGNF